MVEFAKPSDDKAYIDDEAYVLVYEPVRVIGKCREFLIFDCRGVGRLSVVLATKLIHPRRDAVGVWAGACRSS